MSPTPDATAGDGGADGAVPPALRIVRGTPTDEELAALVVALTAVGAAASAEPAATAPRSSWTDRERLMTSRWSAGPGGWRASASRR